MQDENDKLYVPNWYKVDVNELLVHVICLDVFEPIEADQWIVGKKRTRSSISLSEARPNSHLEFSYLQRLAGYAISTSSFSRGISAQNTALA